MANIRIKKTKWQWKFVSDMWRVISYKHSDDEELQTLILTSYNTAAGTVPAEDPEYGLCTK